MSESSDFHEYAKRMFDTLDKEEARTLTGRIPSRPPLPYNFPPTNLREAMAALENAPEIERVLHRTVDFSKIEARTVAYIVGVRGGKTMIVDQLTPEQFYRGHEGDLFIIDEYQDIVPEPLVEGRHEPVKQNGRSASYLQFDKTKQHKLKKPAKRRR